MWKKQLMKLKVAKPPGPDQIPNWIQLDFEGFVAPSVCATFNSSIYEGSLPQLWRTVTACPISKVTPPKEIEKAFTQYCSPVLCQKN